MAKKASGKVVGKRADQYMLRFPEGMRDAIISRASANGRSMNTEIIAALEQYLKGADRFAAVEAFVERHKDNIESIGELWQIVERLQRLVSAIDAEQSEQREYKKREGKTPP
jgi:hypothetical protein